MGWQTAAFRCTATKTSRPAIAAAWDQVEQAADGNAAGVCVAGEQKLSAADVQVRLNFVGGMRHSFRRPVLPACLPHRQGTHSEKYSKVAV